MERGAVTSDDSPGCDDELLSSTLDSLDGAHHYREWILDLIRPHLDPPVLELGAGHGTFTASLAELGRVHAVEPGRRTGEVLAERFRDDERITVTNGYLDDVDVDAPFGSAVLINVLEHIRDDAAELTAIARRLRPGGVVAIWVPAFPLLFSRFDREIGHHRRYRARDLRRLVDGAGFDLVDVRYVNAPGFFGWFVITRLLRRNPTAGPLMGWFDRFAVPLIRRVESRFVPPFGQSLLVVATKRATGPTAGS